MTLRVATPADVPELQRLAAEQQSELGWKVEEVDHFAPPVVLTLVHERDGRIVGGVSFEAVAEMTFLSGDPETTAIVKDWSPDILALIATKTFKRVRCFVPKVKQLPETLGKHFEDCGFASEDKSLSHFSISLRASDGQQEMRSSDVQDGHAGKFDRE